MSIECSLRVATEMSSRQFLTKLSTISNCSLTGENNLEGYGFTASILVEGDLGQQLIFNSFQFTPTICLFFSLNDDLLDSAVTSIIDISNSILLHMSSDAVLLLNGEDVILTRISGRLSLNSDFDFWDQDRRKRIQVPYSITKIPSL